MPPSVRDEIEQLRIGGEQAQLERYERAKQAVASELRGLRLPEDGREMLLECFRDALALGPAGLLDDGLAEFIPWDVDLGMIKAPVRVMLAREDPVTPPAHADWLLSHLPRSELVWVVGGHMEPSAARGGRTSGLDGHEHLGP